MSAIPSELLSVNPGDVVVPLSDMLDLLGSRLDAAELQDLQNALIARRTTQVSAGDLITAELMNQILADIVNLQNRVAALETGIPAVDRPQIVLVNPDDGVRINEQLQVYGFNLAPSQLTSVRMGGRSVGVFSSASHSKMLAFDVPPILGIPEAGADVKLEIGNDFGSDDIMVKVLRSQNTGLSTEFTLSYQSIPAEELDANTTYPVTIRISALTSLSATYNLIPRVDNDEWSAVMQGGTQITIPQSQPEPFIRDVTVEVTTGSEGSAEFWLRIEAVDAPSEFGESEHRTLAVGEIPEVNTEITFASPNIPPANLDGSTGDIVVDPGSSVTFTVNAILATEGETYDISAPTIAGDSGAWTATLLSPGEVVSDEPDEIHLNGIRLELASGTSASSPPVEIRLSVERRGSTEPPAVFRQTAKVRPS